MEFRKSGIELKKAGSNSFEIIDVLCKKVSVYK
jgi:hypothetical protein